MADIPTELTPQVAVTEGNLATKDLLQKLNAIIRVLQDHEARIEELEP
jgi:DNA-directed RNA polymerase beta' subunit